MRGLALFAIGVLVGMVVIEPGAARQDRALQLNHVGIRVENFDEAVDFYTETFGFREAFAVRNPDGDPVLTYLQVNRDTFLELQPAGPGRLPGITHFGLQVDALQSTVTELRQRGIEVGDPFTGQTGAMIVNATDPEGVTIELLELSPESMQQQAIATWDGIP